MIWPYSRNQEACDFSTDDYHKVHIASFPTTEISNTIWYAGSSPWQTCLHCSMSLVPRPFLLQLSFELAASHITLCLGQNSISRCEICYLWNLRGFSCIKLPFFLVIRDKICKNLSFALKEKYWHAPGHWTPSFFFMKYQIPNSSWGLLPIIWK